MSETPLDLAAIQALVEDNWHIVTTAEARALIAEVERLRAEVEEWERSAR